MDPDELSLAHPIPFSFEPIKDEIKRLNLSPDLLETIANLSGPALWHITKHLAGPELLNRLATYSIPFVVSSVRDWAEEGQIPRGLHALFLLALTWKRAELLALN